jgi:hypothetical protein
MTRRRAWNRDPDANLRIRDAVRITQLASNPITNFRHVQNLVDERRAETA